MPTTFSVLPPPFSRESSCSLVSYLETELCALDSPQEVSWILSALAGMEAKLALTRAQEWVERRRKGEPLAYILENWDFRRLNLIVGPGVLVPRPETEELVDQVLSFIDGSPLDSLRIADLGAGSGAIALSLALESKKDIEIFAVEKSPAAFEYLKKNLDRLPDWTKGRVRIHCADWEDFAETSLDVIVSNPPYVSEAEWSLLDPGLRIFEPKASLVYQNRDGDSTLGAYRSLLKTSQKLLKPKTGALFCEFGPAQEGEWPALLGPSGWKTFKDLSGKSRFLRVFDFPRQDR